MRPAYLAVHTDGTLDQAIARMQEILASCRLCPRSCGVDRRGGQTGYCGAGTAARVYSYMAHHGEEPPISGSRGSGTIFFSGCTMRCVYCQNHQFSQAASGRQVGAGELAGMMLSLQETGCHNINLVSPTHYLAAVLEAVREAVTQGLSLPLVYNSSGYESAEVIALLAGIVDIYLPDMRYGDEQVAVDYSDAPGYPRHSQEAVRQMHRQVGFPRFDSEGVIERGLIVRHLVLPGGASGTGAVMRFLAEQVSRDTYISLMSQYMPYYRAAEFGALNRRISREEYIEAQAMMEECGLSNGWTQEGRGLEKLAGVHIRQKP